MRETTKYVRGYMPKIEYWTEMLVQAVKNEDIFEIDRVHNKLDYFINKQHELETAKDAAYEEQAHLVWYYTNEL